MVNEQPGVNQLAEMLKAIGHPLRIQIIMIIVSERVVSVPTLQHYFPTIDQFVLYSNLRYMHKKHLIKKLNRGRDIYFGLSEKAVTAGFDAFFQIHPSQKLINVDLKRE